MRKVKSRNLYKLNSKVVLKSYSNKNKRQRLGLIYYILIVLAIISVSTIATHGIRKRTRVLQLVGNIESYITPRVIEINIVTGGKKLPKSDDPEINAMVAAAQVKKQAKEKIESGEEIDEQKVQRDMRYAAEQALKESYQASSAVGAISLEEAKKVITEKDEVNSQFQKELSNAIAVVNESITLDKTDTTYEEFNLNTNVRCQTGQGIDVLGGETTLGDNIDGNTYAIMRCTAKGWEEVYNCTFNTSTLSTNDIDLCNVTILPSYYQQQNKANCYENNTLISNGSITSGDDSKQCINGTLISSPIGEQSDFDKSLHDSEIKKVEPELPLPTDKTLKQTTSLVTSTAQEITTQPPNIISEEFLNDRNQCAKANLYWDETQSSCIIRKSFLTAPTPSIDKTSNDSVNNNLDQSAQLDCKRLGGSYQIDTGDCRFTAGQRAKSNFVYYNQKDPAWNNQESQFECSDGSTLAFQESGCGQTVTAMIMSNYCNIDITPAEVKEKYFSDPNYCSGSTIAPHREIIRSCDIKTGNPKLGEANLKKKILEGCTIFAGIKISTPDGIKTHQTWITDINEKGEFVFQDPWYGPNQVLNEVNYEFISGELISPPGSDCDPNKQ